MSMSCTVFAVSAQQLERLREAEDDEARFLELQRATQLAVDQQWHGLHYLLTGTAMLTGTESGVPAPRAFLVEGGGELEALDGGYGPARWFSPPEVDDIHSELVDVNEQELAGRLDAAQKGEVQVWGFNWQVEPGLIRKLYLQAFAQLRQFVDEASRRGQGLIVMVS